MDPNSEKNHHWKVPSTILLIGIAAVGGLMVWAGGNRTYQVFAYLYVVPAVIFLLMVWWTFGSGFRLPARLAGLGIVGLAAVAFFVTFRFVGFTGDFIPQFTLRSNPTAEQRAVEYWNSISDSSQAAENADAGEPLVITAEDWPEFRGPNRDGIVSDAVSNRDWKTSPPRLMWKHPIGKGWSSFAVVGRYAFTQEQRINEECVVCYDVETGRQIWKHADAGEFSSPQGGPGPMATPTVYDSRVYTVGGAGILNCLDAKTGERLWFKGILDDAGALNLEWGMSGSPLVYDDKVVVNPGGGFGKSVAAYDRQTGEKLWSSGDEPAGYSSPSLATIGGVRQILVYHGIGISGYDAQTGEELWKFTDWRNQAMVNAAQPIVRNEQHVFISSGYRLGSSLLEVTLNDGAWSVTQKWKDPRSLNMKFTSGVYKDGFVYGLSEQILTCVDYATLKQQWRKRGNFGYGQLLLAADDLLILTERGEAVLHEAKPSNARELGRFQAIEGQITWNHPVLHKGRLLVRNGEEAACYDLNPMNPETAVAIEK